MDSLIEWEASIVRLLPYVIDSRINISGRKVC